jgi:predicted permease
MCESHTNKKWFTHSNTLHIMCTCETPGLLIGMLVARLTNTPRQHVQTVLVACAFGNSTGLPITLLTVVHANFPVTSDLGRVDPTLFLSVYLLLFPVLQWGLGGYLLVAAHAEDPVRSPSIRRGNSLRHNVLNLHQDKSSKHRGLTSSDEGLYMTEVDLTRLVPSASSESSQPRAITDISQRSEEEQLLLPHSAVYDSTEEDAGYGIYNNEDPRERTSIENPRMNGHEEKEGLMKSIASPRGSDTDDSLWQTISNVLDRCLQPPVIGAVLGIICAVLPRVRGMLVDLVDRDSKAPLQFLFDGLYAIGQTAVPLNMYVRLEVFYVLTRYSQRVLSQG